MAVLLTNPLPFTVFIKIPYTDTLLDYKILVCLFTISVLKSLQICRKSRQKTTTQSRFTTINKTFTDWEAEVGCFELRK